jgi:CubicO group peptidase (beta-lactamase class C family)
MGYWKWRAIAAVVVMLIAAVSAGCTSPTSTGGATGSSPTPRPYADAASRLDAAMVPLRSHEELSGALLVSHAGVPVASRAYGWGDTAGRVANRTDTRFRIGSITKQFTAMAVLLLQERGRLRVGDPVCRHLAACPAAWRQVTLRHLLTHTSGIPDYTQRPDLVPHDRAITPVKLASAVAHLPLDFPVGSRYSYSNSGYAILGHIIERVARQRYADFLHAAILDPLALDDTGYDDRPVAPAHAIGHSGTGVRARPEHASVAFAAGAMYSTVADLARWTHALFDRRFAAAASVDAMLAAQVSWCDSNGTLCTPDECVSSTLACTSYGYGWELRSQPNRSGGIDKLIEHGGAISGFRALSRYEPDRQIYLVVLTNSEALDPDHILRLVRDATISG